MRLIHERKRKSGVDYFRVFEFLDTPGAGCSFPSDEKGNVNRAALSPEAEENLDKCLDGTFSVRDCGVDAREWSYYQPAVGKCDCGAEVTLHGFTNTCDDCGADYNSSGQRLAPRECWGEETGESAADILAVDMRSAEENLDNPDH